MKLKLIVLAALLSAAGYRVQAQTVYSEGHTYIAIPADTLAGAQATATAMGGHLMTFDSEIEYGVANQFVKRNTGWWWVGTSAKMDEAGEFVGWFNDDESYSDYSNTYLWMRHRVPSISGYTTTQDERIVMGCFQIIPRSTKWTMKVSHFSPSFYSHYAFRSIVEIDSIPLAQQ